MTTWLPDLGRFSGPRYRAIADALAADIAANRLPPGTRLPTHAASAAECAPAQMAAVSQATSPCSVETARSSPSSDSLRNA